MADASPAASAVPMERARRVFTWPGTGGLAKIQTGVSVTGPWISILPGAKPFNSTQLSAAAGASDCRTAEAVITDLNLFTCGAIKRIDVPDGNAMRTRDLEHLVEVTVVQTTIPGNANERAAHDAVDCGRIESAGQQRVVMFVLADTH